MPHLHVVSLEFKKDIIALIWNTFKYNISRTGLNTKYLNFFSRPSLISHVNRSFSQFQWQSRRFEELDNDRMLSFLYPSYSLFGNSFIRLFVYSVICLCVSFFSFIPIRLFVYSCSFIHISCPIRSRFDCMY